MLRCLMTAFALSAMASPAAAEAINLSALTGAWTFETAAHEATGCVIRGDVAAVREGDALTMQLNATETCPGDERPIHAVERCRATMQRDTLAVRCVLVSADTDSYLPDQFDLPALSHDELAGRLWDRGIWNAPVRWRRPASPLVS